MKVDAGTGKLRKDIFEVSTLDFFNVRFDLSYQFYQTCLISNYYNFRQKREFDGDWLGVSSSYFYRRRIPQC